VTLPSSSNAPAQGLIFNIQRCSIQDGPGIRTTVFFKGCPLSCPWCSNPESIHPYPEILLRDVKCIHCGNCVDECPQGAIQISEDHRLIDFTRCNQCLRCVEVCTARAIDRAGDWRSVAEIMDSVMRDMAYYRSTGGGVTLSGGEPLCQWRFARELAKAAQTKGIHVALDTSGYASWKAFSSVLEHIDLVLYDIKHMDADIHQNYTGVSNSIIVKNLLSIMHQTRVPVWVRVPVIPAFNHTQEAIGAIGTFLASLPRQVEKVSLLPFHQFGAGKYPSMGRPYAWSAYGGDPKEKIADLKRNLERMGLRVEIGK
jgi:pyruvate formate lyase activating enzyme